MPSQDTARRTPFEAAVRNVAAFGDTDILPFAFERLAFRDLPLDAARLVERMDRRFEQHLADIPIHSESCLSALGPHSFRRGTQIDALWNAYFLGLVIALGPQVERTRVPQRRRIVFSNRFRPNALRRTLFDLNSRWYDFQVRAQEMASVTNYVVACDVANFFPRVAHEELLEELNTRGVSKPIVERLQLLLRRFEGGRAFGLPVGGPASRLLSELVLDSVDRTLMRQKITFCRYADDFRMFFDSKAEVRQGLLVLAQALDRAGLSFARGKTHVLSTSEFLRSVAAPPSYSDESKKRALMSLNLRVDLYASGAERDDRQVESAVREFDIVAMLTEELERGRIDRGLTKKMIRTVAHLEPSRRKRCIDLVLGKLDALYPVFGSVVVVLHRVLDSLEDRQRARVHSTFRDLVRAKAGIAAVPAHTTFAVRLLARDPHKDADRILKDVYSKSQSPMLRRDVILALSQRKASAWLRRRMAAYKSALLWERRAILAGTSFLDREGQTWRNRRRRWFKPDECLLDDWVRDRAERRPGALFL